MKCNRCGTDNSDLANYCLHCGAPLHDDIAPANGTFAGKRKIIKRTAVIGAAVLIASGALIGAFVLFRKSGMASVSLITDNAVIQVSGQNGSGTVSVEDGCPDYQEITDRYSDGSANESKIPEDIQAFISSVSYQIVMPDGKENGFLSNDDTVRIVAVYDHDLAEKANISVAQSEYDYTVSGLNNLEELDLFDQVEIKWASESKLLYEPASFSSMVSLSIRSTADNDILKNLRYSYAPGEDENTIIVTAEILPSDLQLRGYCAKDDQFSKEYQIEKEPEEITALSGDDIMEAARKEAEKIASLYMNTCPSVTTDNIDTPPQQITGYSITDIWSKDQYIWAEISFTLSSGNIYEMRTSFNLYRMADQSISSMTEYNFGQEACEVLSSYINSPD